jgi:hypothetical protein
VVDLVVGLLPALDVLVPLALHEAVGVFERAVLGDALPDAGEVGDELLVAFVEAVAVDEAAVLLVAAGEAHEGLEEVHGLLVQLALLVEVVLRVQQLVLDHKAAPAQALLQPLVVGLDDLQLQPHLLLAVGVVELQLGQHVLGGVVVLAQLELLPLDVVPQDAALVPALLLLLPPLLLLQVRLHLVAALLRAVDAVVRLDVLRGGEEGDAAQGGNGLLLALRIPPLQPAFLRVSRVPALVHLGEGVPGPWVGEFCEGRQEVVLVQVVALEVLFDFLEREGRAVVVQVLLDLSPVAEAPQFEGGREHYLVHEVPVAAGEALP